MATRAGIFFQDKTSPSGVRGVYHHGDGYPEGLGRTLWRAFHEVFDRDLAAMKVALLDRIEASEGWSDINNYNLSLAPCWVEFHLHPRWDVGKEIEVYRAERIAFKETTGPQSYYCRGERDGGMRWTSLLDAADSDAEYAYVVSAEGLSCYRLSSGYPAEGSATAESLGGFLWSESEPDWQRVNEGAFAEPDEDAA